jgi:hypothetical protein
VVRARSDYTALPWEGLTRWPTVLERCSQRTQRGGSEILGFAAFCFFHRSYRPVYANRELNSRPRLPALLVLRGCQMQAHPVRWSASAHFSRRVWRDLDRVDLGALWFLWKSSWPLPGHRSGGPTLPGWWGISTSDLCRRGIHRTFQTASAFA